MLDVVFVGLMVALFALTALFVKACERIIGTDEEAFADSPAAPPEPVKERDMVIR